MRFEKVTKDQYKEAMKSDTLYKRVNPMVIEDISVADLKGFSDSEIEDTYNDIKKPKRATRRSAGYDFYAPYEFTLSPGDTIKIATGIRVLLDDDKFLMCAPRSGHGFKARIQLDNTIGIIDADYSDSDNEGHIMVKLTNDSHTGKTIKVAKGDGMIQAIILQYFLTEDDDSEADRNGGFGSTDEKN